MMLQTNEESILGADVTFPNFSHQIYDTFTTISSIQVNCQQFLVQTTESLLSEHVHDPSSSITDRKFQD